MAAPTRALHRLLNDPRVERAHGMSDGARSRLERAGRWGAGAGHDPILPAGAVVEGALRGSERAHWRAAGL